MPSPPQPDEPPQHLVLGGTPYVVLREDTYARLLAAAGVADASERPPRRVNPGRGEELSPLAIDAKAVARRLLDRRRRAGLSQAELARRAGVRVETLNRIERGKTTPDFATVRKLAVALQTATHQPQT